MSLEQENADLRQQLRRSERIIAALVERVERATEFSASDNDGTNYRDTAFSVFETAVAWEWRVHARTGDQQRALSELARALADLGHANAALQREVRERAAAEAALLDAKLLAEQLNTEKTRFLAAVSHDLIQPLNAARLFVGAIANQRLATATRGLIDQTNSALDSVEEILEALLEIAQLDAGAVRPSIEPINLDLLLEHLAVEFRPIAKARDLDLAIETGGPAVASDARLLRRILQNLISNALRYTEQGRVEVVAVPRKRDVVIEVRDTGPGIARKDRDIIFREFSRLERGRAAGGVGLGLAIVDRAARTLGHRLTLTSRVGHGTTFRIAVPLATIARAPRADAAAISHGPLVDRRILVIENERTSRRALRAVLESWGCEVKAVAGEEEASAACARGFLPQLFIADYHLDDGLTGDVAIARLRQRHGLACPTIVITADRDRALHHDLAAQGHRIVPKPVKPDRLHGVMQSILRRERAAEV